jgi:hemerythrin-like domain-containing protein
MSESPDGLAQSQGELACIRRAAQLEAVGERSFSRIRRSTVEATRILMEEHRVIERVLASIEAGAGRLAQGKPMRLLFFVDAADFVKGFADGCHHRKEEGVLFPAMEAAGVPREGGPIGVMLAEHEEGRRLIQGMRAAAQKLESGDASSREGILQNAQRYVALLRQHIVKEDHVLFPMADKVITGEERDEVAEAFERVEHEETGEGAHEKYLGLAEALEREIVT